MRCTTTSEPGGFLFFVLSGAVLYKANALWVTLIRRGAWWWMCLFAANLGFLRGLWNLGVATSSAQRFWFTVATQLLIGMILWQLGLRQVRTAPKSAVVELCLRRPPIFASRRDAALLARAHCKKGGGGRG